MVSRLGAFAPLQWKSLTIVAGPLRYHPDLRRHHNHDHQGRSNPTRRAFPPYAFPIITSCLSFYGARHQGLPDISPLLQEPDPDALQEFH